MQLFRRIRKVGILLLVLVPVSLYGYDYRSEVIADSLKEGANAVIRDYSVIYTQQDINNGLYKVSKVITVLNDKGDAYSIFYSMKDKFRDLQKFEGVLKDDTGAEIKKIKKKDLIESSLSEGMVDDGTRLYYKVQSPTYPYTIEYTYEIKYKNGILSYPSFYPIGATKIALEKASYRMEVPYGTQLRFYNNCGLQPMIEEETDFKVYTYKIGATKAIEYEPLGPLLEEILPNVRFGVTDFCYDNVCGDYSTWKDFGFWQNKLLEGRDALSPEVVEKIKSMTQNATTERQKIEVLYKYLQDNSRYVSIQLGIGGLQPFPAQTTWKNRFGDCKALTNLMMAMLKVVDIPSIYTVINMGTEKKFLCDFADPTQANHVILNIPLQSDTIWLECTSQSLPMGYIHDGIEGHDALLITDQGGLIRTLPSYSSSQNLAETITEMNISDEGVVTGRFISVEHAHGYGDFYQMMRSNDRDEHIKYISTKLNLPNPLIGEIKTAEDVSDIPSCSLDVDFEVYDMVNKSGRRMFIPMLPLKKGYYSVFKSNKRDTDIEMRTGLSESDSVRIIIPEGYQVESIPSSQILSTPYGELRTTVERLDNDAIVYKQYVNLYSGRYSKDEYQQIKEFFNKIVSASKGQIVLKKIES